MTTPELALDARTLEDRAQVFKALGHPTRVLLVELLNLGPTCVADLTTAVGADVSTVSRHLAVLRMARIVSSERRGAQVFYRLAMPCVLGFFRCVEAVAAGEEPPPMPTPGGCSC